jgi:hypothetical protein
MKVAVTVRCAVMHLHALMCACQFIKCGTIPEKHDPNWKLFGFPESTRQSDNLV